MSTNQDDKSVDALKAQLSREISRDLRRAFMAGWNYGYSAGQEDMVPGSLGRDDEKDWNDWVMHRAGKEVRMGEVMMVEFTPKKLKKLKKAYEKAVELEQSEFVFDGHTLVADYAKYLIEYLDSKFEKVEKA